MVARNLTGMENQYTTGYMKMDSGCETISNDTAGTFQIVNTGVANIDWDNCWAGEAPAELGKYQQYNHYWPQVYPSIDQYDFQKQIEKSIKKQTKQTKNNLQKKGEFYIMKRLVQVVVVDPDSRVPDENSIVHMGEHRFVLTSLSDEDLLLDIDLKSALKTHNQIRSKILDEDRTDNRHSDVFLKPVKVSDLEKRVVVLQKF